VVLCALHSWSHTSGGRCTLSMQSKQTYATTFLPNICAYRCQSLQGKTYVLRRFLFHLQLFKSDGQTSTIFPTQEDISLLWDTLSFTDNAVRKPLVLICRAMYIPKIGEISRIAAQSGFMSPTTLNPTISFVTNTFRHLILSPLWAGLVIDICRCAPYESSMVTNRIKKEAWGKEISVLESRPLPPSFNYQVWLDPSRHHEQFHWEIPANPRMARYIHNLLVQWRQQQCSKLHYPRMSRKQCSYDTQRNWEASTGESWSKRDRGYEFSQVTTMRYYSDTGIRLRGVNEIRQKWYRSGIAPRTYFAMGADAFFLSCHIQGMMTDLVNICPVTNHVSRLNPNRVILEPGEYLRIWDLSSFTSNHVEQKWFIRALADWCRGYTVELVDPVLGIVEEDLGEYLDAYNAVNWEFPYSLERVLGEKWVAVHNVAGFLGVYGNLMSCTFVHGGSVLQTCQDADRVNVAGDDGHKAEVPGDGDTTTAVIRGNGVVEPSKEFATYEEGSVCLKRPVVQIGQSIFQRHFVVWPSLALIGEYGGYRANHYQQEQRSRSEWRSAVALEVLRFLDSIYWTGQLEGAERVVDFLRNLYEKVGLPPEGSVPQCGGSYLCPRLPATIEELYEDVPLRRVLVRNYRGTAILPYRMNVEDGDEPKEWDLGYEWQGNSDRRLTFMEKMGWVEKTSHTVLYLGEEGLERLLKEYFDPGDKVYTFCIVDHVPYPLRTS
jgi:hypothetical protein